jgi:hypothetical protein
MPTENGSVRNLHKVRCEEEFLFPGLGVQPNEQSKG